MTEQSSTTVAPDAGALKTADGAEALSLVYTPTKRGVPSAIAKILGTKVVTVHAWQAQSEMPPMPLTADEVAAFAANLITADEVAEGSEAPDEVAEASPEQVARLVASLVANGATLTEGGGVMLPARIVGSVVRDFPTATEAPSLAMVTLPARFVGAVTEGGTIIKKDRTLTLALERSPRSRTDKDGAVTVLPDERGGAVTVTAKDGQSYVVGARVVPTSTRLRHRRYASVAPAETPLEVRAIDGR